MTPHIVPDMEEYRYHGIKAVSSTLLKEMRKSALHAKTYLEQPQEPEKSLSEEKKKAFREGKLIERAILEPERLSRTIVKPEGMSFATKEGKAFKEDARIAGKDVITFAEEAMLRGITDSVASHKDLSAILKASGMAQPSLFAEDEETGLPLKARLDWLSEGNVVLDLKSTATADPAPHGFPREIAKYRYHLQAYWYLMMAELCGKPKDCFVFVAIEKKAPYCVTTIQLDSVSIGKGRDECRRLLAKYKECVTLNSWPGYSDKLEIVTIPEWSLREEEYESPIAYQLES